MERNRVKIIVVITKNVSSDKLKLTQKYIFLIGGYPTSNRFCENTAEQNFVRNGFLEPAHFFTLEATLEPFGTSTQINSPCLLD